MESHCCIGVSWAGVALYGASGSGKSKTGRAIPTARLLIWTFNELVSWSARYEHRQERPSIRAHKYMILRSPAEFQSRVRAGSRTAVVAKKKFDENVSLWQLAAKIMGTVDPEFAAVFTGLAITQGFQGSPHIDTTNIGPFYGLAVGDFADETGGIQVEVDPMTVAEVNTKGRLGKVDGRFPHWVAPYDEACDRFSLIYYQTEGEIVPKSKAIFGTVVDNGEFTACARIAHNGQ